jgi:flagellar hook-associated protein 1 FlgK
MDVKVSTSGSNQVNLFTNSGIQLVGGSQASQFTFTSPGTLNATSLYNTDPTKSGVGSLTITLPNGASMDVVANNVISSGKIAADLTLRDTTLVQAQAQVDQMAATLSSSLSDQTTAGTAVTSGSQSGFTLNLANMVPGNTINLTVTNNTTNTQQNFSIVSVSDPSALPLAERDQRQSEADRNQFHRRHGLGCFAIECGARCRQPAILQSFRFDAAGAR